MNGTSYLQSSKLIRIIRKSSLTARPLYRQTRTHTKTEQQRYFEYLDGGEGQEGWQGGWWLTHRTWRGRKVPFIMRRYMSKYTAVALTVSTTFHET